MKKAILLIFALALPSFAIYVDVGGGVGKAATYIGDKNIEDYGFEKSGFALESGVRVGGRIVNGLYVTGDFGYLGDYYEDKKYGESLSIHSWSLGTSIILYPLNMLQISASIGYSFMDYSGYSWYLDIDEDFLNNGEGFMFSCSVAYATGKRNSGLFGLKFYLSAVDQNTGSSDKMTIGVVLFGRYVYRSIVD